jgi:hypothetical protein
LQTVDDKLVSAVAPMAMTTAEVTQTATYGPYMTTSWNQNNPYNKFCPTSPTPSEYYGDRAPSGCVATAFAQVISYHAWPVHGVGSITYVDNQGSITGTHYADFSNPYDWQNLLDSYEYDDPYQSQFDAVAEIMYELGVASSPDYEAAGTASYTSHAGEALTKNLYYEQNNYMSTQSELIVAMEEDLKNGLPAVVSIPGHAIVVDGMIEQSGTNEYHFNYGWGGTNNGWWTSDDIDGSALTTGITSIRPRLIAFPNEKQKTISTENTQLDWLLPKRIDSNADTISLYRFKQRTGQWYDDASELNFQNSAEWSTNPDGFDGNCYFAGPIGPASFTFEEVFVPDSTSKLDFQLKYRLGSIEFKIFVSDDQWATEQSIFSCSDHTDLSWALQSVSLADYAGKEIKIRAELDSEGSYYPDSGGVWLDNLTVTSGTYKSWHLYQADMALTVNNDNSFCNIILPPRNGQYTLAAAIKDTDGHLHEKGPAVVINMARAQGNLINMEDLAILFSSWQQANPAADFVEDGVIDMLDLMSLAENWLSEI